MGGSVKQRVDAERERHLLDPTGDRRGAVAAALERECQLRAHGARDELGLGILEQRAGERPQARRSVLVGVEAGEGHPSREAAAVEMGHEATGGVQQRGLSTPREAREQAELAWLDLEADITERRSVSVRVAVGDMVVGEQWFGHGSIPRRSQNGKRTAAMSAAHRTSVSAPVGMRTAGYAAKDAAPASLPATARTTIATADTANAMSWRETGRARRGARPAVAKPRTSSVAATSIARSS